MLATCIDMLRGNNGKVISYKLRDSAGREIWIRRDRLKEAIFCGTLEVDNLTFTSDGRLISKSNSKDSKNMNNGIDRNIEEDLSKLGVNMYNIVHSAKAGDWYSLKIKVKDIINEAFKVLNIQSHIDIILFRNKLNAAMIINSFVITIELDSKIGKFKSGNFGNSTMSDDIEKFAVQFTEVMTKLAKQTKAFHVELNKDIMRYLQQDQFLYVGNDGASARFYSFTRNWTTGITVNRYIDIGYVTDSNVLYTRAELRVEHDSDDFRTSHVLKHLNNIDQFKKFRSEVNDTQDELSKQLLNEVNK